VISLRHFNNKSRDKDKNTLEIGTIFASSTGKRKSTFLVVLLLNRFVGSKPAPYKVTCATAKENSLFCPLRKRMRKRRNAPGNPDCTVNYLFNFLFQKMILLDFWER